jgi:hypothetical protein
MAWSAVTIELTSLPSPMAAARNTFAMSRWL